MATTNPYQQYHTTQVQTAGPAQLTLMCYDGVIRFLSQAREAMTAKRYDVQSALIGKTQALLGELLKGLDFERGGEIARSLDRLYRYFYDRLTHANIQDDLAALDQVKKGLVELRDAWGEAIDRAGAQGASEPERRDFALAV
jgi:flagellar protein FliS